MYLERVETNWEEIYVAWTAAPEAELLAGPLPVSNLKIRHPNPETVIFGYDWCPNSTADMLKNMTPEELGMHLLGCGGTSGKSANHTLNMLIDAQTPEERAAVWILSFLKETDRYAVAYDLCGSWVRTGMAMESSITCFLNDKIEIWSNYAKQFLPELALPRKDFFIKNRNKVLVSEIVHIAAQNAARMMAEYQAVAYISHPQVEKDRYWNARIGA